MTHLTLIRHGETDWNRARLIQGSTDIPLNETGRAQARQTAERLRGALEDPTAARIVSSDLSRARETAQIIADQWGSEAPLAYSALRERAYGEAEGLTVDDFAVRWGNWYTAEVPGAESREQLPWREVAAKPPPSAMAAADAHTRRSSATSPSEGHPPPRVRSSKGLDVKFVTN